MIPPVPPLDVPGYIARTKVAPQDVAAIAAQYTGFIERRVSRAASWIYARLGKRYATPFGQTAPPVVAIGTTPPTVTLTGRPVRGSLEMVLEALTPGGTGTATFWWSADGGQTWTIAPTLSASGTTPPAATVAGLAALSAPSALLVNVTTAGARGTARFVWSSDGGATWNLSAAMASSGTTPPGVSLSGAQSFASAGSAPGNVRIQITTGGALGTAVFEWSKDGGSSWTTGLLTSATPVPLGDTGLTATFSLGTYATNNAYQGQGLLTAASVALGATGLTVGLPAGTYAADNVYTGQGIATAPTVSLGATGLTAVFPPAPAVFAADNVFTAPTPIPEIFLGWVVALVDVDVWGRRGVNPQDPSIATAIQERDAALAEIKEAADAKDGLFELPTTDQTGDTAVVKARPLSYTEASPFVWADQQEAAALGEDCAGVGTYGGLPLPSGNPDGQPGGGWPGGSCP